jgi:hypothetical protein
VRYSVSVSFPWDPFRSRVGPVLVGCIFVGLGCGFQPREVEVNVDATIEIDAADATTSAPPSCATIHVTSPSSPSGTYVIDPDGPGGEDAFSVMCDMTTEGGGWTVVFFAANTNITATPVMYTSASSRLLGDALRVLLVYRNASQVVAPDYATFAVPDPWRADMPLNYASTDLSTAVSINGGTDVTSTVRFGYQSFTGYCADPWNATMGPWGRICIIGTTAPFYAGFATPVGDTCSDSMSLYSAVACRNDLRFSIAVK